MNRKQRMEYGSKARVFLVDDHPVVPERLALLLQHQPDLTVCGEATDTSQALERLARAKPDVVIVDISLPGRDGIELLREVRRRYPGVSVVIFSVHDLPTYADRALQAGADGYVCKTDRTANVLVAIRRALAGGTYISPGLAMDLAVHLARKSGKGESAGIDSLSDRERDVFFRIGQGHGTAEIATALSLSKKTIESYRESIKAKLRLRNGRQLHQEAFRWAHEKPVEIAAKIARSGKPK